MRARRAFTLLELLVVIGILVALAAIVLPYGTGMIERHAFQSAVDSVEAQMVSARAYAQREGVVVELSVEEDGARVVARTVDLLAMAQEAGDGVLSSADGMDAALRGTRAARALRSKVQERVAAVAAKVGAGVGEGGEEPGAIHEGWAALPLEAPIRATIGNAPNAQERPEFELADETGRIALFLPDGSAVAARQLTLYSEHAAIRFTIDPLLGEIHRGTP